MFTRSPEGTADSDQEPVTLKSTTEGTETHRAKIQLSFSANSVISVVLPFKTLKLAHDPDHNHPVVDFSPTRHRRSRWATKVRYHATVPLSGADPVSGTTRCCEVAHQ